MFNYTLIEVFMKNLEALMKLLEHLAAGDTTAWIYVGICLAIASVVILIVAFVAWRSHEDEKRWKEKKRKKGKS
jgi:hypothetical protein